MLLLSSITILLLSLTPVALGRIAGFLLTFGVAYFSGAAVTTAFQIVAAIF